MAVLTPIPTCSLQRSGSLWQLGIEAQELTTSIAQLVQQLEADDEDARAQALAELEAALLAEEGNKQALAAGVFQLSWRFSVLSRAAFEL